MTVQEKKPLGEEAADLGLSSGALLLRDAAGLSTSAQDARRIVRESAALGVSVEIGAMAEALASLAEEIRHQRRYAVNVSRQASNRRGARDN